MNTFYPIIKVLTTSCCELYLKFCAWFSAIVTLTVFPPNMCRQTVAHFVWWWAEDPPKQRRWWLGPGCAPRLPSSLLPSTPGNRRASKCWSQNGANTHMWSSQHGFASYWFWQNSLTHFRQTSLRKVYKTYGIQQMTSGKYPSNHSFNWVMKLMLKNITEDEDKV